MVIRISLVAEIALTALPAPVSAGETTAKRQLWLRALQARDEGNAAATSSR